MVTLSALLVTLNSLGAYAISPYKYSFLSIYMHSYPLWLLTNCIRAGREMAKYRGKYEEDKHIPESSTVGYLATLQLSHCNKTGSLLSSWAPRIELNTLLWEKVWQEQLCTGMMTQGEGSNEIMWDGESWTVKRDEEHPGLGNTQVLCHLAQPVLLLSRT